MTGNPPRQHRDFCAAAYRAHAVGLRGFVTTIILDPYLAEDVVHETFLDLWRHPGQWDPARADLLSWLRTIAHRRAIDRIRSIEAARHRDFRVGIRDYDSGAHADDRDALFIRAQLSAALAGLTDKQREAVLLRYLGERTVPEIAQQLGISTGTAGTRVRDGVLALRHALAPRTPTP
ncbi:sigma-70 family RNA polymerase sigma factor [Curtobacterium sp. SP.BCp]|uniref:sigma-70 family RNA polymerase sigma factor n=1 Tax=Curtobacterium sp. SP.BCp TaxID=3435230 RepID=UPI003F73D948